MKPPQFFRMFNYDKNLLPNRHLANLEHGVKSIKEAIPKTGHSIGYPGWNLLYYSLLCSLRKDKFNTIVETGSNIGCSTIILAQALKDSGYQGMVYSVELIEENYLKAKDNIKKAELIEFIDLYIGNSLDFLSNFLPENKLISFAFLDGCHDEEHVFNEFSLIDKYLDNKSIVFFDNTYLIDDNPKNMRVNGALKRIKAKYKGNLINFENTSWHTTGQAIWQKAPFFQDWNEVVL